MTTRQRERTAAVTLLGNGELDTLALGQGDPGLLSADDEDVALPGGEGVVNGVLEVNDGETTVMALTVGNDADTTHVAASSDHGNGAGVELDKILDLASLEVNLDGVVDLDQGVRVTDAVQEGAPLAKNPEGSPHTSRSTPASRALSIVHRPTPAKIMTKVIVPTEW